MNPLFRYHTVSRQVEHLKKSLSGLPPSGRPMGRITFRGAPWRTAHQGQKWSLPSETKIRKAIKREICRLKFASISVFISTRKFILEGTVCACELCAISAAIWLIRLAGDICENSLVCRKSKDSWNGPLASVKSPFQ